LGGCARAGCGTGLGKWPENPRKYFFNCFESFARHECNFFRLTSPGQLGQPAGVARAGR
jgi:hypothetical protein